MKYCSQCYWSSNDPNAFPPYWYCVLHRCKQITRDEDVCEDWLKIDVNVNQSITTNQEEQK